MTETEAVRVESVSLFTVAMLCGGRWVAMVLHRGVMGIVTQVVDLKEEDNGNVIKGDHRGQVCSRRQYTVPALA